MALQAASLLPSAFSLHKEGKSSSANLKDSSFFGVALSCNLKSKFTPAAGNKELTRKLAIVPIRAQTAATTPAITQSTSGQKKTLRKGNVIITGAFLLGSTFLIHSFR